LFVTYRYFPESYFDAYWTGNAVSVIFTVAVMDEILHSLFKDLEAFRFWERPYSDGRVGCS